MPEKLPYFKYHPDPVQTGNVVESDTVCICCEKQRGYIYIASVYTTHNIDNEICPWCIADGSAANKFDAYFFDGYPLFQAKLDGEIIEEVTTKTPGFVSWQQEVWQVHCHDACEFHGDLEVNEAKNLSEEEIQKFCLENEIGELGRDFIKYYEKGGDPAIYKFVCRHCGEIKLYTDFT